MRPVVTPAEMAIIDAEDAEPVAELIARAGWATARAAIDLLDRPYGARVAILAGKGNNGADGRAAIPHLEGVGAHCTVFDIGGGAGSEPAGRRPGRPEPFDLIIDACYGTGLRSPFDSAQLPIDIGQTPVLAVDIPSGVDGTTGQLLGSPLVATATVTFAAAKPGLLLLPGRRHVGRLIVADIGLDCSRALIGHLEPSDLAHWPIPADDDHKWRRAVAVVGGGPGMSGAPRLAAQAALRAGAGYVTLSMPGSGPVRSVAVLDGGPGVPGHPIEAVEQPVGVDWADELAGRMDRFGAAVIGPGLADTDANRRSVTGWWVDADRPAVFDAGALTALSALSAPPARSGPGGRQAGPDGGGATAGASARPRPGALHVVTPHDGEYTRLAGRPPGIDRLADARDLARSLGAVVLLKGPTTVVADPAGRALVSTAGDARLATAGTGDVLSGVVAAGLAAGLEPLVAAGLGAELHGRAARLGHPVGLVASDLPALLALALSERRSGRGRPAVQDGDGLGQDLQIFAQ